MYLFFDTETTGMENRDFPRFDLRHWPRLVQIGWLMYDDSGKVSERQSHIVNPVGYAIPDRAVKIHGITTNKALKVGILVENALNKFKQVIEKSDVIIGHNIGFDIGVVDAEFRRKKLTHSLFDTPKFCTMKEPSVINHCKLPNPYNEDQYKWPRLPELYYKLFGQTFEEVHDALVDTEACARCYFELKNRGII